MPSRATTGPEDEKDQTARICELEDIVRDQNIKYDLLASRFEGLLRDQGLQCAIENAAGRLAEIFEPLKVLAPSHEFGDEKVAITALRLNLARPSFDAPPVNFGQFFVSAGEAAQ